MLTTFPSLAPLLPAVVLGCAFGGHHAHQARPALVATVAPACCDGCGIETAKVHGELARLATAPKWTQRDNAAHALAKFDWRCHPEIPAALAAALLTDCDKHVRQEAAQALGKLSPKPCTPEVHLALDRAARCDPSLLTRKAARKALDRIGRACVDPCGVCTPGAMIAAPAFPPSGPALAEPAFLGPGPIVPGGAPPPPTGYSLAPGGAYVPSEPNLAGPNATIPPPAGPIFSEPGLEPLPPLDAPSRLPAPGLPSPTIPPLPGEFPPFGPPPEARRDLDGRISARDDLNAIRGARIERVGARLEADHPTPRPQPGRPRGLAPFSLLRPGR